MPQGSTLSPFLSPTWSHWVRSSDNTGWDISMLTMLSDVVEALSQCLDAVGKMGKNGQQISRSMTDWLWVLGPGSCDFISWSGWYCTPPNKRSNFLGGCLLESWFLFKEQVAAMAGGLFYNENSCHIFFMYAAIAGLRQFAHRHLYLSHMQVNYCNILYQGCLWKASGSYS